MRSRALLLLVSMVWLQAWARPCAAGVAGAAVEPPPGVEVHASELHGGHAGGQPDGPGPAHPPGERQSDADACCTVLMGCASVAMAVVSWGAPGLAPPVDVSPADLARSTGPTNFPVQDPPPPRRLI